MQSTEVPTSFRSCAACQCLSARSHQVEHCWPAHTLCTVFSDSGDMHGSTCKTCLVDAILVITLASVVHALQGEARPTLDAMSAYLDRLAGMSPWMACLCTSGELHPPMGLNDPSTSEVRAPSVCRLTCSPVPTHYKDVGLHPCLPCLH